MTTVPRHHLPEIGLTELSEAELRARVARAQMYVLELHPVAGTGETTPQLHRDHLAYLYKLEMSGRLYASGQVASVDGAEGYELAIVVATDRAEADAYAANDPLRKAGLVETSVTSHIINEGVACYFARELSKRAERSNDSFDTNIDLVELSYDDLVKRAVGANMHLIRLKPSDKPRPTSDKQIGYEHFLWLRGNEMRARLMSCGPFEIAHPPGIWGGGLAVVAATSSEAEETRSAEPSGLAGYRLLTVEPWVLDYGIAAPVAKALETLNQVAAS